LHGFDSAGIIRRLALVVRIALAAILLAAAVAKARRPSVSASGLATYGIPEPLRAPATLGVVILEAALAIGVAAGADAEAYAAAALLAFFAAVIAVALARGQRGAPCGCFGADSRVGTTALVRNVVLAAAFATVPSLPSGAPSGDGWLVVALVAAFACIAALTVAVLALAREVGILRLRLGPESALDVAGEGPALGSQVELAPQAPPTGLTLAIFSSQGCRLCRALEPVVAAFRRDPLVNVTEFDEVDDAAVWRELGIPGSPYAVALDASGRVRAKGTFNSYGQLEGILASAERSMHAHA